MGFEESSPALRAPSIFSGCPPPGRPHPEPLDRRDRLDALARHLPFAVDDFDAARAAYARWRADGADADLRDVQLWAYCYVVWYAYGTLARDAAAGPGDLDWVVDRACHRVFGSLAGVRDADRFPQFVSVVCRNVVRTYRRRRPTDALADVAAPGPEGVLDALDRPLVRDAVARAVAALPPAIGEVARMRLIERRDYAAIAAATGRPVATTRAYLSKALARLRDDPTLRAVYLGEAPAESALAASPEGQKSDGDGVGEGRSAPDPGLRS